MRGRNLGCETNDCIVLGHPTFEYGKFVGGITLQESPDKKKKGVIFYLNYLQNPTFLLR